MADGTGSEISDIGLSSGGGGEPNVWCRESGAVSEATVRSEFDQQQSGVSSSCSESVVVNR